ncbi:MAG: hypothetical protein K8R85_00615 [Bacteroidetes bacterium]|nr:hypothetical protein [Bacteroidota bacterium]
MKELDSLLNDVDQAQLLGYAGDEKQSMLLGQLAELAKKHPAKAAAAVKKIASMQAAGGNNLSPRDQAILRIDGLPKPIREALFDKRLQLVDDVIYVAKAAGGLSSVEMFKSDDDKVHGASNIAKAQLDKDLHFIITSVRLTSGIDPSVKDANYGIIAKEIANGDFEFKINGGRYVFPKDSATSRFDTTGKQNVLVGEFILSTPKWIEPDTDIIWDLKFSNPLAALTNIRAELIGVRVIKA